LLYGYSKFFDKLIIDEGEIIKKAPQYNLKFETYYNAETKLCKNNLIEIKRRKC